MIEACFCGRVGPLEDREVVFGADDQPALRCPQCGHTDALGWMPAAARASLFASARLPEADQVSFRLDQPSNASSLGK